MNSDDSVRILSQDALDAATPTFSESPPPPSYSEVADKPSGRTSEHHLPKQESAESSGVPQMKVYAIRWYILILFSCLACHQCVVWNTWGPIASSVQAAYGWSDGTVAMMANWGTIMFVLCTVPLSLMLEIKGLRPTCLLVSAFVMVGSMLRCCRRLIADPKVFLASSHICAILNGISGVTIMASPPVISSLWFPQNERTTATSINQAGNMLGNGLSMLIGPALVKVNDSSRNGTTSFLHQYLTFGIQRTNISFNRDIEDIKDDIDVYMYIDFGVALFLFVCFCVYYPSKPPLPPTPTSTIVRTDFRNGVKQLLTNKDVLLVCFSYSLSEGIMGSWMGVMVLNLRDLNITDQEVGYIGLASVVGQCLMAMVVGYLMDMIKKRIKLTLIVLLALSGALYAVLTLMCLGYLPSTFYFLAIAIVLATSLNYACCPLYFELCVEIAYPVSETLVAGFLTMMYNLVGIIFLFIFFIPNIGSVWINYVLVGSVVVSIPSVVMVKETYNRSSVDDLVNTMSSQ